MKQAVIILTLILLGDTLTFKLKTIIPKREKSVYIFRDSKSKLKLVSSQAYTFSDTIKIIK